MSLKMHQTRKLLGQNVRGKTNTYVPRFTINMFIRLRTESSNGDAIRLAQNSDISLISNNMTVAEAKPKRPQQYLVPLDLEEKSASWLCWFPKVKDDNYSPGNEPVYLNVYDLTPINGYFFWAGVGIFHSGVEVHGVEYAFGAHDYATSGVFEVEPRCCPGFKFRKSVYIGTTTLDPVEVRRFMERHSSRYHGNSYHLIANNCNHFCKDVCYRLTGKPIPKWVNRLARIGSVCSCLLPEALKTSVVRPDPDYDLYENEKLRLRCGITCRIDSMRPRALMLPQSPRSSLYPSPLSPVESKMSKGPSSNDA